MLESTCNSLNITKNQKEDRLKETAGIAYAVIRDEIANPNEIADYPGVKKTWIHRIRSQ